MERKYHAMIPKPAKPRLTCRWGVAALCGLLATSLVLAADKPAPSTPAAVPVPTLTLDEAVRYALENNPELAAVRQQRGIAEAGVVIARAYPFNPVWEGMTRAANGPAEAGITNRIVNEHKVSIDVELRPCRAPSGKSPPRKRPCPSGWCAPITPSYTAGRNSS